MDTLLNDLSKAVSYAFRKDATCPGVLVSTLKDGSIYSSVVRYGKEFKSGKQVVCKCVASDVDTALSGLTNAFLDSLKTDPVNPIEVLRNRKVGK